MTPKPVLENYCSLLSRRTSPRSKYTRNKMVEHTDGIDEKACLDALQDVPHIRHAVVGSFIS